MNTAEWILVVILSVTLFIFLIVGIVLIVKLLGLVEETRKVVIKGQTIADNANGVVNNVKGMTSFGGAMETFVKKYVEPKLNAYKPKPGEKTNEKKEEK